MEDFAGKICPFCTNRSDTNGRAQSNKPCSIPQHQEFWYDEQKTPLYKPVANRKNACMICGDVLINGQEFCLKCGYRNPVFKGLSSQDLTNIFSGCKKSGILNRFPFSLLISIILIGLIGYFVLFSIFMS